MTNLRYMRISQRCSIISFRAGWDEECDVFANSMTLLIALVKKSEAVGLYEQLSFRDAADVLAGLLGDHSWRYPFCDEYFNLLAFILVFFVKETGGKLKRKRQA